MIILNSKDLWIHEPSWVMCHRICTYRPGSLRQGIDRAAEEYDEPLQAIYLTFSFLP